MIGYIGRYIRRPAIAVSRIEEYDGQFVTFRYYDKTEKKDKLEKVTVEEFIARLIRHILDEQFKTIRHYGVLFTTDEKFEQKASKRMAKTSEEMDRESKVDAPS